MLIKIGEGVDKNGWQQLSQSNARDELWQRETSERGVYLVDEDLVGVCRCCWRAVGEKVVEKCRR